MRIGDILYFSPNVKFADLGTAGPQPLLEALRDRRLLSATGHGVNRGRRRFRGLDRLRAAIELTRARERPHASDQER